MVLTDVANQALMRIGQSKAIDSIDDVSSPATLVKVVLATAIRDAQALMRWPELIETLTPDAHPDLSADSSYRYPLPANVLMVLKVEDATDEDYLLEAEYRIEGSFLLTAAETASITVTRYNETPDEWSGELLECVVMSVASRIAFPVTQSRPLARETKEEYEMLKHRHMRQRTVRTKRVEGRVRWADRRRGYNA